MDAKLALTLPLLAGLSFCNPQSYTGSLCPVGPFIADAGAATRLTRAEKQYVVTLNESGERICGWAPPGK